MSTVVQTPAVAAPQAAVIRAWRSPLALPVLIAVAVVLGTFWYSPNFRVESSPTAGPFAGDFLQEWLGGYIVRAGDHSRFYDVDYAIALQHDPQLIGYQWKESEYLPIVYPPFYYLLLSPLSYLSVYSAARLWCALMTAAFAANVWLLWRADSNSSGCLAGWFRGTPADQQSQPVWYALAPWLVTVAVFFSPLIENLVSSQKGTICLLILSGTFVLLDQKRPFAAGVVFGLLAFKPQFTLVIALTMLWKRQWRFVGGGALTGSVLVGLSLSLGWNVCHQYFSFATGMASYIYNQGYDLTKSHCLYGFFALLLGAEQHTLVKLLTFAAALGVVWLLSRLLRGELELGEPNFAVQFSSLVLVTLLVSPHLFTYDLTILLLPMLILVLPKVRAEMPPEYRNATLWLATVLFALAGYAQEIAKQFHLQVTTIVMLMLLALLALLMTAIRQRTLATN